MAATVSQLQAILATDKPSTVSAVDARRGDEHPRRGEAHQRPSRPALTAASRKAVQDARDATNNLTAIVATDTLKVGTARSSPGGSAG